MVNYLEQMMAYTSVVSKVSVSVALKADRSVQKKVDESVILMVVTRGVSTARHLVAVWVAHSAEHLDRRLANLMDYS
jgi:hypothetical protein